MNWNSLTLAMLAAFGLLSLFVTLLVQLARQIPELMRELRAAWRALGTSWSAPEGDSTQPPPPRDPPSASDPDGTRPGGNAD